MRFPEMHKKGNSELKYTYTKAACSLTYFHSNMMVKLWSRMVVSSIFYLHHLIIVLRQIKCIVLNINKQKKII